MSKYIIAIMMMLGLASCGVKKVYEDKDAVCYRDTFSLTVDCVPKTGAK